MTPKETEIIEEVLHEMGINTINPRIDCVEETLYATEIIEKTIQQTKAKLREDIKNNLNKWKSGCSKEVEEAVKQFSKELLRYLEDER
jgi:hypothetical protein